MKNKILTFFIIIGFFSCSQGSLEGRRAEVEAFIQQKGKIKVLTTTEMIRDIVQQIGGDKVLAISLISKNLDPHSYQLVKGDDELLYVSSVIFSNGLGLEHGASLNAFLHQSEKNIFLGDTIDRAKLLYFDGVVDPHIWMDIALWSELIDPIVENLSALSPQEETYFRENAEALREKMLVEHKNIHRLLQKIPEDKRYLVTSHDAFNYFTRSYLSTDRESDWKKRFMAPEGLSPDSQLSIVDIQKIVNHLNEHKIQVLFTESGVNEDSIRKVLHAVQTNGLSVRICEQELYADSMIETDEEIPYLAMISYNARILFENLVNED